MLRLLSALLAGGILAGAAHAEPGPIPVEDLFKNPTFSSPRLSPDGKHIAFLYSEGDRQLVMVRQSGDSNDPGGPIAAITDPNIRLAWLAWANNERLLLSGTTRSSDGRGVRGRRTQLFAVDANKDDFRWLARRWPVHGQGAWRVQFEDQILSYLPDQPDHVLIAYRDPIEDYPAVKRLNIKSGALRSFAPMKRPVVQWHVDADGRLRAGEARDRNGYHAVLRASEEDPWERHLGHDSLREAGLDFAGFSEDPNVVYVAGALEGRSAIYSFDLATGQTRELIWTHRSVDAGSLVYAADGRRLIGVRYVTDWPSIHYFDQAEKNTSRMIRRFLRTKLKRRTSTETVSTTQDGNLRIIRASGPTQPPVHFAFDATTQGVGQLMEEYPRIDRAALTMPEPISFEARDGRTITGYLTIPAAAGDALPPLIVLPHGGPWSRDMMRWDPEVQLFASRGYAVLQVNFRGSTGFGSDLYTSGFREQGLAIQDDITDGVHWAVSQARVDRDRIGIYGTSFGGYSALMNPIRNPGLYRAAASYAGVADFQLQAETNSAYIEHQDAGDVMVGDEDDRKERARLRTQSPLARASEMPVPVLLGHGQDDDVVNAKQSRQMRDALEAAGKRVEYMQFENEIHGFLLEENRVAFYTRLVSFFDEHLASRSPETASAETP